MNEKSMEHGAGGAEQAELPLGTKRARRDEAQRVRDIFDFECLVTLNVGITRRELCALRPDWNDRYIGEMAEHSRLVLSFPGSPGYRMISAAADEEIAHGIAAIDDQVAKMMAKRVRFSNILGLRAAAQKLGDTHTASEAQARDLSAEYFEKTEGVN